MTKPDLDPCRCPLCEQPNACAMACGDQVATGPCWCTLFQFSPELLRKVPEAARNRACICQRCATTEPKLRD